MPQQVLLGDEAVALGAVHAGLTAAYAYPGTPSTEIMEALLDHRAAHGGPHAAWCANEKTAFECALGTSFESQTKLILEFRGTHRGVRFDACVPDGDGRTGARCRN